MTHDNESGKVNELSQRTASEIKTIQIDFRKTKKTVDKYLKRWYSEQAVAGNDRNHRKPHEGLKKTSKNLKKLLTSVERCGKV